MILLRLWDSSTRLKKAYSPILDDLKRVNTGSVVISKLTEPVVFGLWSGLYLVVFGIPFGLIINSFQSGSADNARIMLVGFAFALTVYFWMYDLLKPGLKADPNMKWYGFVFGFATIVSLAILLITGAYGNLLEYTLCLSTVYVLKALWHRSTKSSVNVNDYETLHLAILTDAVASVILGIVGFTWRVVFSTVTPDISHVFLVVCIVVTLAAHYHLTNLWILRRFPSGVIPSPPSPSSSTLTNKMSRLTHVKYMIMRYGSSVGKRFGILRRKFCGKPFKFGVNYYRSIQRKGKAVE